MGCSYTGDRDYLWAMGWVLIAIQPILGQRVHWSSPQQRYVMHGVFNEYENNVNNNWAHTLYRSLVS